jgi:hypothetical protein
MKYLVLVFSIVLFGCAQSPPSTSNVDDWQLFGEQTAMKGFTKKDEATLSKSAVSPIDSELYAAYDKGYEAGRIEYCSQNPRSLGRKGEQYHGICDDIDKFFRMKFEGGAQSKIDLR